MEGGTQNTDQYNNTSTYVYASNIRHQQYHLAENYHTQQNYDPNYIYLLYPVRYSTAVITLYYFEVYDTENTPGAAAALPLYMNMAAYPLPTCW